MLLQLPNTPTRRELLGFTKKQDMSSKNKGQDTGGTFQGVLHQPPATMLLQLVGKGPTLCTEHEKLAGNGKQKGMVLQLP